MLQGEQNIFLKRTKNNYQYWIKRKLDKNFNKNKLQFSVFPRTHLSSGICQTFSANCSQEIGLKELDSRLFARNIINVILMLFWDIVMDDVDADALEALLRFFYTGSLNMREMDFESVLSLHNAGFFQQISHEKMPTIF
jgi:hypothetical protein